jgi:hypothetical protein
MAKALLDDGHTIRSIAKDLRLSTGTVQAIKNGQIKPYASLVEQAKKALDAKLALKSNLILDSIDNEDISKASLLQKASSYGILFDKQRLNSGQSSQNVSIVDLTNSLNNSLSKLSDTFNDLNTKT